MRFVMVTAVVLFILREDRHSSQTATSSIFLITFQPLLERGKSQSWSRPSEAGTWRQYLIAVSMLTIAFELIYDTGPCCEQVEPKYGSSIRCGGMSHYFHCVRAKPSWLKPFTRDLALLFKAFCGRLISQPWHLQVTSEPRSKRRRGVG